MGYMVVKQGVSGMPATDNLGLFYEKLLAGDNSLTTADCFDASNHLPSDFTFVFSPKSAATQLCYYHNPCRGWVLGGSGGWVGDGAEGGRQWHQQ